MRRSEHRREEDALLRDSARRFLEDTYAWSPTRAGDPQARWRAMAELGWFALGLPEALGGIGGDSAQCMVILEEAGRVLDEAPLLASLLLAALVLAALPLEVAQPLADGLQAGSVRFAYVPDAGLRLGEGGTLLSGRSRLALGIDLATHWIVPVGSGSANGAAVLLLPASAAAALDRTWLMDGRTAAVLSFADLPVAPHAIVARGEAAYDLAALLADAAAVGASAEALGAADAGLALTVSYLKDRTQFGAPLATFQAVQHMMAESFCEIAQMRSLLMWAADALAGPAGERAQAASALKAYAGMQGLKAVARCIQVSGGIGVTQEYRIGHVYKRLQTHAALFGSTQEHLARFGAAA
ncbi:acyl-CoA dehydrogenase family protein [Xanthobacter sp. V7C-4]|uniref:acyl-CoA dehydrogenase family protein n=1 Tax=Xanthobacter autotrophicus (strain ATCC BAA-1158 / Py2) TaxID=78245 RepID=UPI00372759CD